jgi:hypothetical protein
MFHVTISPLFQPALLLPGHRLIAPTPGFREGQVRINPLEAAHAGGAGMLPACQE